MNRNKVIFLTTCMLMMAYMGFSQVNVDSLLLERPQSTLDSIGKARAILIDAFVQRDKQKVQKLEQYLSENFDQNSYVTLFPSEHILLLAWLGDFGGMLQHIQKTDSVYIALMQKKIMPVSTSNFYQTIRERAQQESEVFLSDLQTSSLTQEEKDFVAIYYHYYLVTEENFDTIVSQINTDTRKFIATYPNSEYIKLLDSYELKPSDWGWGFGISAGYAVRTGNFSTSFKNGGALDLYFDIAYKQYMATIGLSGQFGKAREDIITSDELMLPKDISGNVVNFYLSFGYRFFEDKRLMVTPIAGIGTSWIYPGENKDREKNPTLEQFDYSYGLTTNFGLMMDIRLDKMKRIPGQHFIPSFFYAIRLSYKFSYNTLKDVQVFYDGNLHTITIGIYMFGKGIRQVKYK